MKVTATQTAAFGSQPCAPCAAAAAATKAPPSAGGPSVVRRNSRNSSWIVISLVTSDKHPVPNEPYRVTLPDGEVVSGRLDVRGRARIEGIPAGECRVVFPEHDVQRDGAH